MRILAMAAALALLAQGAAAGPRVAADIAPVHALAAQVMAGIGEPELIIPPGASPHHHALRPSEAAALAEADLVVRIGAGLTPWLGDAVATLAPGARDLELAEAGGVTRLAMREGFGGDGHAEDDDHGHGAVDPHLWLDPENGRAWLTAIAAVLAEIDPANAARYAANAEAARTELAALAAEVEALLAPVRGRPYVLQHDALQYFEARFTLPALGAIAPGDDAAPGPARVAAMRELAAGAVCIFVEAGGSPRAVAPVAEGSPARIASLDPTGATLAPGPGLYAALIRGLAADLANCLGD